MGVRKMCPSSNLQHFLGDKISNWCTSVSPAYCISITAWECDQQNGFEKFQNFLTISRYNHKIYCEIYLYIFQKQTLFPFFTSHVLLLYNTRVFHMQLYVLVEHFSRFRRVWMNDTSDRPFQTLKHTYGCRGMSVHPQNLWHLFELLFPKSSATEWLPCYVLLSAPRMNFGFFLELAVYPIRKPSFITVNIWSPLCRSSKHVLLQAACIFLVLSLQILYRIFCFFPFSGNYYSLSFRVFRMNR